MRRNKFWCFCALLLVISVLGCAGRSVLLKAEKYETPLPEGVDALVKMSPQDTGLDLARAYTDDKDAVVAAIDNSLNYLSHPSSRKYFPVMDISHERAVASLVRFKKILLESYSGPEFRRKICAEFDAYISRGWDGSGTVLFTGYYTPIFDASLVMTPEFKYPLYGLPPDLIKDKEGKTLGRRLSGGKIVSYYTREEIEKNDVLKGLELVWLADRFENYVVTIQGSAKLRLPDGRFFEIGYAGNNGHAYHSVLRDLVRDGRIPLTELSLRKVVRFFKKHPREADRYLYRNQRYVFFMPRAGEPRGSLNVPVTPFRSVATDKSIFPRACLVVVSTDIPQKVGGRRGIAMRPATLIALDQDTGGAIRAAGRCDIYMGVGDDAGDLAGRQLCEGILCYLFVKKELMGGK